ncbi:vWA domain-containing protein [Allorhizobium sonneratiae]|uniref:vWA domain-containing protein n=1 Tax=Allorhizobium sonneratiae TaxID=2934936 RepID=UPI002034A251|nr:TadE/TadG family type IV pilus assembly protein [Allorhizobium sonneratiae]
MSDKRLQSNFHRLIADKGGNFGIMTAIILPIALGSAGLAMDATKMVETKRVLQSAVDAATLAAASALSKGQSQEDAEALANSFIASQLANALADEQGSTEISQTNTNAPPTINISATTSGKSTTYTVNMTKTYTIEMNPLSQVMGWKTVTLSASSTAQAGTTASQRGLSLYLVLDRSGSMSFVTDQINTSQNSCQNYTDSNWGYYPYLWYSSPCYINKSTALKTAVAYMAQILNNADPTYSANSKPQSELIRMGADSFNGSAQTPQNIQWGTSAATTYVNNIPTYPTGGTDATGALTNAYNALKSANTTEAVAHASYGVSKFDRYLIFMTDGEMTGNSSTWNSSLDANVRSLCASIKADGIQIFTVAFMAPDRGKSLLQYCASSSDDYFQPNTMADIVAAFGSIAEKATQSATRLTN